MGNGRQRRSGKWRRETQRGEKKNGPGDVESCVPDAGGNDEGGRGVHAGTEVRDSGTLDGERGKGQWARGRPVEAGGDGVVRDAVGRISEPSVRKQST